MLVKRIVRDPGDAGRALLFSAGIWQVFGPTIRPTNLLS
jgi:hypothetical protein